MMWMGIHGGRYANRPRLMWRSPMARAQSGGAPTEAQELDAVVGRMLGSKGRWHRAVGDCLGSDGVSRKREEAR